MTEKGGYYFDVVAFRNSDKVRLMDFETRAAYRDVMDEIWITGFVPENLETASRLTGVPIDVLNRVWPAIQECLIPAVGEPGKWTSERMEVERKKRNRIRKPRKKFGQTGGKNAQAKKRQSLQTLERATDSTQANAKQLLEHGSKQNQAIIQVQEQVLVQGNKKNSSSAAPREYPPDFLRFWEAYPEKVGKTACLAVWKSIKPSQELVEKMLATLAWQKTSNDWTRENGKYIPDPERWLKKGRWDDEPPKQRTLPDRPVPVC